MPDGSVVGNQSRRGPILAVLIILLVFVLAGLYLWGAHLSEEAATTVPDTVVPAPNNEPETQRAVADQQILTTVGTSDELSAIEADLAGTNLDTLESEYAQVEQELERALTTP
jgi:hypothetical protein